MMSVGQLDVRSLDTAWAAPQCRAATQGEIRMAIDEAKLNDFMGKFVTDLGAVMHAATVVVGDQLGLYKALAAEPQFF